MEQWLNKIAMKLKNLVLNRKHGSKYIKDADRESKQHMAALNAGESLIIIIT